MQALVSRLTAATLFLGAAAIGAPAAATIYTATFTGTFGGAADLAGLFGPAGTDLRGQAFTATYRVDTGVPGVVDFTSGNTRLFYSGEYYYGGLPTAMSATLSANGHSVALTGNYKGSIVQENDLTPVSRAGNGDDVFYEVDETDHANRYFSLSFTVAATGFNDIFPTENFAAPGHYSFTGGAVMDNRFSFAADGSNLAYGSLYATDLVIAADSSIPEPAAWTLLIAGFALTGAALRRHNLISEEI